MINIAAKSDNLSKYTLFVYLALYFNWLRKGNLRQWINKNGNNWFYTWFILVIYLILINLDFKSISKCTNALAGDFGILTIELMQINALFCHCNIKKILYCISITLTLAICAIWVFENPNDLVQLLLVLHPKI